MHYQSAWRLRILKLRFILKNAACTISLFRGFFEKNILTFNPVWDSQTHEFETLIDMRDLQHQLKTQSVKLESQAKMKPRRILCRGFFMEPINIKRVRKKEGLPQNKVVGPFAE